jgi:ABC-type branched-subunit amino acid transport system substrate-binding protein
VKRTGDKKNRSLWLPFVVLLGGCFAVLLLALADSRDVQAQNPLTEQQRRGKQIYLQGTSPSGKEILAYIGDQNLEVPGSTMACANCHGLDGRGKPEGGVIPSNLTWEVLTTPYGLTHADGRKHPPYTVRAVELAIKKGLDPAGNKLQNLMPRYAISSQDMADLIVYLESLGHVRDPGISETELVIGTVVPTTGPQAELGQAIKAVNVAFFAELNNEGGIYNRRVDLKFAATGDTAADTRANLDRLLKTDKVFALIGSFIAGAENEIVPLMADQEVPLIGPFTLYPQTGSPLNRQVFYLLSGLEGQARALVEFAGKRADLRDSPLRVVFPRNDLSALVFGAIKDESRKAGMPEPESLEYVAGHFAAEELIKKYKGSNCKALLFLGGSDDLQSLLREADREAWFPRLLLPASSGSSVLEAPPGFDAGVFLSFPTSPDDQGADGLKEFRALVLKYQLPAHHLAAQVSAFAAAKILVEGLKRAGKDLSREKLIQSLEGLYQYQTGMTPAITYGPNRRIGANGAYIVAVDLKEKKFVAASGWIDVK